MKINVIKGDITTQKVDAIVNAANSYLIPGGGVDGAIHKVAGKELYQECKTLNGCKTGEAKLTKGYNLPAKFVIHTVGPVWINGEAGEPEKLASCYNNCMELAFENNFKSIAFPSISTGVYGFPIDQAAKIAHSQVNKFQDRDIEVIFVCFEQDDYLEHVRFI